MGKVSHLLCIVLIFIQDKATSRSTSESGSEISRRIFIPAMAQKAGGSLRPEFSQSAPKNPEKLKENEKAVEEYDYDEWSNEGSSEEMDCPRKQFYHIRGKQCVPLRCSNGRDQITGQCKDEYGYGTGNSGYNRVYNGVWGRNVHYRPKVGFRRWVVWTG